MSQIPGRPSHGCYKCRGYIQKRDRPPIGDGMSGPLKEIHKQFGCAPYPDTEVSLHECVICTGLWLRTFDPGCIMNIREDHARELFPDLSLRIV